MTDHKAWLDNEYLQWIKALQESTVDNFKEHPMVKRMLGEVDYKMFWTMKVESHFTINKETIRIIDTSGHTEQVNKCTGTMARMIYYALKILELNPQSIVEIGAGVGQFYAVLRALGYKGHYYICDLPEVREFQLKYLSKVSTVTGLSLEQVDIFNSNPFCISFYALGEFDDKTKIWYINKIVNQCEHGFLIWNAHSGATNDKLKDIKHEINIQPEQPLTSPGNLQIIW